MTHLTQSLDFHFDSCIGPRNSNPRNSSEFEGIAALAAEMEEDDLVAFLQISVNSSPTETLSLISFTLFNKTNTMDYMDQALHWEVAAAVSATSDKGCAARLAFLVKMLSQSAESFLRATN